MSSLLCQQHVTYWLLLFVFHSHSQRKTCYPYLLSQLSLMCSASAFYILYRMSLWLSLLHRMSFNSSTPFIITFLFVRPVLFPSHLTSQSSKNGLYTNITCSVLFLTFQNNFLNIPLPSSALPQDVLEGHNIPGKA